ALETLEHALLLVLGDADALVLDGKGHHAGLASDGHADGITGLGEANGIGEQIVQHLPNPRLVGDELHRILGNADVEIEACTAGPVAHAEYSRVDHGGDPDRRQLQLERTGVDGGEIENVVDDGEQRA